ncbi:MAG: hypothetical protein ACR2J8_02615 [Thermomicrobiales bacterium]
MYSSQDRRTALARLAAGASSIVVAARELGVSAAGDVEAEKKKKKKGKPQYTWNLPWGPAVFTKHPGNDPKHYNAVVGAFGSGTLLDLKSGEKRTINDKQLERMIMKRTNGGKMNGMPQLRLDNMNWRVLSADYDPSTKTWMMDLEVCDSNPHARPDTASGSVSAAGDVSTQFEDGGCTCSNCDNQCYVCTNGAKACADKCSNACSGGCR